MKTDYDFEIIFKKLKNTGTTDAPANDSENELREISELRKIVLEITEPELNSYTTS